MRRLPRPRLLIALAAAVLLAAVGVEAAALWLRSPEVRSGQLLVLLSVESVKGTQPTPVDAEVLGLALRRSGSKSWTAVPAAKTKVRLPGRWEAPKADNLYLSSVPQGSYAGARLELLEAGGRRLYDQQAVRLSVSGKGISPLLFTFRLGKRGSPEEVRAGSAYGGSLEVNYGLQVAAGQVERLPDVSLENQSGQPVSLGAYRGKVLVLASFITECQEECPLVAAGLLQLRRLLAEHDLLSQVQIVEVTQDPSDDVPAILAKYQRYFDLPWPLLTGSSEAINTLWSGLGVAPIQLEPWDGPAATDPFTGQKEPYNITHASVVEVVNPAGYVTEQLQSQPTVSTGEIPETLYKYLDAQGLQEQRQGGEWSAQSLYSTLTLLLQRQGVYTSLPSSSGVAVVGQPAPSFQLPSTAGGETSLSGELGHPVLIDFWATWCDNCRADLHLVAGAPSVAPGAGLQVMLIDFGQSPATARGLLRQEGITLPSLLDRQGKVANRYGVPGLPVAVFVNSRGVVAAIQIGQLDATELSQDLEATTGS